MFVSCSLCSVWVLGGGLCLPSGDRGSGELCPGPDLSAFTSYWPMEMTGPHRPQRMGACGGWGWVGGSYLHPERCHSPSLPPSLPPSQLCHISLQASANSLGSRGDQAHSAQGRKGPAVCLSQSTCDCLDGTGRWAPKEVPDPLSRPLQAEGAAPRCSAPTSGPCYYTRGP